MKNQSGQALIEFSVTTLLLVLPLTTGCIAWCWSSYEKSKCWHRLFWDARAQLIQNRSDTVLSRSCGKKTESLTLYSLESLDHKKDALDFNDWINEASELWGEFSSSSSSQ